MGVFSAPPRSDEFREALTAGLLSAGAFTADGAMGTMLASKGVLIHRCLDELNLSLAALVRDVHREYIQAGAQIIGTNTFGANRSRLSAFGFADKVRAINKAGVRIAREAARAAQEQEAFVAGVVGPLGIRLAPLGPVSAEEARAIFREQIDALVEGGVDLLVLETFRDLDELREAIVAAREAAGPGMVISAHVSVEDDGTLACGASMREAVRRLEEWPVDVIGVNCSSGPKVVLETIEAMAGLTTKPLSAMPNAGLPSMIDGTCRYPCSPEYIAQYARRFLRAGARIVGGCCGTTPEHIREIRSVMSEVAIEPMLRDLAADEESSVSVGSDRGIEKIPMAERSQLGSKLASGKFVSIVEILPPRGPDALKQIAAAAECRRAGIDAIAVPDGPRAGARMSALALSHLIQQQAGIECVLHVTCRDRNARALQAGLLGANAIGLHNLLCITGDPPRNAAGVYEVDSIGLATLASNLNQGLDLGGHGLGSQTSLVLGVGVNPASANLDEELRRFELKLKAGAEFAVTQPVFDADLFESFVKRIEPFKIPIIAGIWPLASLRNAEFLINELHVPVPSAYMARMSVSGSKEAAHAEGVKIAREVVERIQGMVAGIQLSAPSGCHKMALEVAEGAGSRR